MQYLALLLWPMTAPDWGSDLHCLAQPWTLGAFSALTGLTELAIVIPAKSQRPVRLELADSLTGRSG